MRQFREKMLITHRGLSGPAILQISSYWKPGTADHDRPRSRTGNHARHSRGENARFGRDSQVTRAHSSRIASPHDGWNCIRQRRTRIRAWTISNNSCTRGRSLPQEPKDTKKLKSPPAESIPTNSPPKPWRAAKCQASTSSEKSSTSPATSADSTSSGPGPPARPRVERCSATHFCAKSF